MSMHSSVVRSLVLLSVLGFAVVVLFGVDPAQRPSIMLALPATLLAAKDLCNVVADAPAGRTRDRKPVVGCPHERHRR